MNAASSGSRKPAGECDSDSVNGDRPGEVLPDDAPRVAARWRVTSTKRRGRCRAARHRRSRAPHRCRSPSRTPTFASVSAGASLTPSPTIATTRPVRRAPGCGRRLSSGSRSASDFGDAEPAATASATSSVVAGEQDRVYPHSGRAPRRRRLASGRTASAIAIAPRRRPSRATNDVRAAKAASRLGSRRVHSRQRRSQLANGPRCRPARSRCPPTGSDATSGRVVRSARVRRQRRYPARARRRQSPGRAGARSAARPRRGVQQAVGGRRRCRQ